ASAKVKTVNEDVQIRYLVDGKKILITEASIRRDLRLDDAEGIAYLSNAAIFDDLARIGHPSSRAAVSVNTARPINTAYPRSTVNVVSDVQGNKENVVKSSACWIWRPTRNVIDHISKDSGSYMLKRFNYVYLQGRLKSAMAWVPKRN
nr:hypothetical protein [Tanacetum cinerariifolium]